MGTHGPGPILHSLAVECDSGIVGGGGGDGEVSSYRSHGVPESGPANKVAGSKKARAIIDTEVKEPFFSQIMVTFFGLFQNCPA